MENAQRAARGHSGIVELGGVGPAPFCCMLLADLGADIVRIDRPPGYDGGAPVEHRFNLLLSRASQCGARSEEAGKPCGRRLEAGPLKPMCTIRRLPPRRRGKARAGTGCRASPLIPRSSMADDRLGAGRAARAGAGTRHQLHLAHRRAAFGGRPGGPPAIPLNLAGDFGGGSLYLALGVVSALLETTALGRGQVIDAAMVDGSASLMTLFYGLRAGDYWRDERGVNRLDSGAPWYNVYETKDGRWLSLGSNEARFWRNTLASAGTCAKIEMPAQHDRSRNGPPCRSSPRVFRTRTRDEWCALAQGRRGVHRARAVDGRSAEKDHPHLRARETFVENDGVMQPALRRRAFPPRRARSSGRRLRPARTPMPCLPTGVSRPRNLKRIARGRRDRLNPFRCSPQTAPSGAVCVSAHAKHASTSSKPGFENAPVGSASRIALTHCKHKTEKSVVIHNEGEQEDPCPQTFWTSRKRCGSTPSTSSWTTRSPSNTCASATWNRQYPYEAYEKIAQQGWLGILIPEEAGGSGGDIFDYSLMAEGLGKFGFDFACSVCADLHGDEHHQVRHAGTESALYVKPFIEGKIRFSVSISEPDAGSDAANTKTRARRDSNGDWIVSGQKLWCSGAAAKDTTIAMLVRTGNDDKHGRPVRAADSERHQGRRHQQAADAFASRDGHHRNLSRRSARARRCAARRCRPGLEDHHRASGAGTLRGRGGLHRQRATGRGPRPRAMRTSGSSSASNCTNSR